MDIVEKSSHLLIQKTGYLLFKSNRSVMKEIFAAQYKNLKFIQKSWKLSDEDLCVIFRVDNEDVQQWHQRQSINSNSVEAQITSLMRLYEVVSEKFKNDKEAQKWLTTVNPSLNGDSPIQCIADDPHQIALVTSLLNPN